MEKLSKEKKYLKDKFYIAKRLSEIIELCETRSAEIKRVNGEIRIYVKEYKRLDKKEDMGYIIIERDDVAINVTNFDDSIDNLDTLKLSLCESLKKEGYVPYTGTISNRHYERLLELQNKTEEKLSTMPEHDWKLIKNCKGCKWLKKVQIHCPPKELKDQDHL